ncbi:MAG: hypothetical protein V1792_28895 [Pseudomonadota bacterium]
MTQHAARTVRPFWQEILIGIGIVLVVIISILGILAYCFNYYVFCKSVVLVRNLSGHDVWFEKIAVDDKVLWESSNVIIRSPKDLSRPLLDTRRTRIVCSFRPPWRTVVKLTLIVLDENLRRQTLSCSLDNTRWPCSYTVDYYEGRLVCHCCEKLE